MQNNELQQFVDDVSADEVRLYRSTSRCNAPSMRNDAYYTLLMMSPSWQWSAMMPLPMNIEVHVNA